MDSYHPGVIISPACKLSCFKVLSKRGTGLVFYTPIGSLDGFLF